MVTPMNGVNAFGLSFDALVTALRAYAQFLASFRSA